jgi:hypothetical protein
MTSYSTGGAAPETVLYNVSASRGVRVCWQQAGSGELTDPQWCDDDTCVQYNGLFTVVGSCDPFGVVLNFAADPDAVPPSTGPLAGAATVLES